MGKSAGCVEGRIRRHFGPTSNDAQTATATGGSISVEIVNHSSGYSRRYRLAKWAGKSAPVVPGKKKRAARK